MLGLCLALLLDASGSVDAQEWRLQVEATAAAIEAPETVAKIVHAGGAAVWAAEFASITIPMVDWHVIRTQEDAKVFAAALVAHVRQESMSTASGDAIMAAVSAFASAPPCERLVVDISTDGWANSGALVADAVHGAQVHGAMVNAIVIEDEPDVLAKYRDAVNGFALPATWDTYGQAIKQKLNLEISYAPTLLPQPDFYAEIGYEPFVRLGTIREFYLYGAVNSSLVAVLPGDDVRNDRGTVSEPRVSALLGVALLILAVAAWRRR